MTWNRRQPSSPARDRLAFREQEAERLMESGEYRAAFNLAVQAAQAELARVFRDRPGDGVTLYAFYVRQWFKVARAVREHWLPEEQDLRKVGLTHVEPRGHRA